MALQDEIDARRRLLKSDRYAMSVGELMNLYQSKELDLHPDFQRFFRWSDEQKAKLIESILLGIPLPPVFVSQRQDGVWDVIDGLQRLSAIFQFAGILRNQAGAVLPALTLTKVKYLPSLDKKIWEDTGNPENPNALTAQQRIDIKRSKIDVNIILRESNADAKYDMFERLNTGGTTLSEQEVRNCLLLMSNKDFFNWIEQLSLHPSFVNAVSITDRAKEERYDMELVVRFIALRTIDFNELRGLIDLGSFLTDRIIALSTSNFNLQQEGDIFRKTFDLLDQSLADATFRRYDVARDRFMGPALVSSYEVLAIGLGNQVTIWNATDADRTAIKEIAKAIWTNPAFTTHQGSGVPRDGQNSTYNPARSSVISTMTKVRSREECLAAIQADSAWRKKEMSFLKGKLLETGDGEADALRRSAVVMVYAHWEGFVKNAAELYLSYINELITRHAIDLSEHFKNLLMWKMFKRKGEHVFLRNPIPFLEMLSEWPCSPEELLPADIIDTESNLNSMVLRRLVRIVNVDYTFFETKEKLIDESLLKTRNQIAHGNRLPVAVDDYENIEQEIRGLIDRFQLEIEVCIQHERYRAPRLA